MPYRLLADLVLTVHFGIVAFVVGGLVLVVVGNLRGWRFVNGWWFRLAHVAAIAVVVAQAWLGVACPLTTLESRRRGCSRQRIPCSGWSSPLRGGVIRRAAVPDVHRTRVLAGHDEPVAHQ